MRSARDRARGRGARWLVWPTIVALILAALVPHAALGTHEGGAHSGRAIGVHAEASIGGVDAEVTLCDTGELDESGAPLEECERLNASAVRGPLIVTASLLAGTTGEGDTSESTASIQQLDVAVGETVPGLTDPLLEVTAAVIERIAIASCDDSTVALAADSTISELGISLLGQNVPVDVEAGGVQEFTVGTATMTVRINDQDEEIEARDGGEYGQITVIALNIVATETTTNSEVELVLSEAYADIMCPAADVAAPPTEPPATPPETVTAPAPGSSPDDRGQLFVLLLIGTAAFALLILESWHRRDEHST